MKGASITKVGRMSLRVVSYNVHSLRDDLAALAAVVRGLEPDVVIVQEAPRRWRWRTKCAELADSFDLVVGVGGLPSLGNLIMTNFRVRVRETWCLQYPITPGRHLRGAAFARCELPGGTRFVVAGSHLSTDDGERPGQAALLRPALAAVEEPLILGTDVNETPDGASWQALTDGLVDAAVAAGKADQPTFPTNGPTRRIDGIFLDPRVRLLRYHVFDGEVAARASDHYPLVVDLDL